jgi:hypothetical protein
MPATAAVLGPKLSLRLRVGYVVIHFLAFRVHKAGLAVENSYP